MATQDRPTCGPDDVFLPNGSCVPRQTLPESLGEAWRWGRGPQLFDGSSMQPCPWDPSTPQASVARGARDVLAQWIGKPRWSHGLGIYQTRCNEPTVIVLVRCLEDTPRLPETVYGIPVSLLVVGDFVVDVDHGVLTEWVYLDHPEIEASRAGIPQELVERVRWQAMQVPELDPTGFQDDGRPYPDGSGSRQAPPPSLQPTATASQRQRDALLRDVWHHAAGRSSERGVRAVGVAHPSQLPQRLGRAWDWGDGPQIQTDQVGCSRCAARGDALEQALRARNMLAAWIPTSASLGNVVTALGICPGLDDAPAAVKVLARPGADVGELPAAVLGVPVVAQSTTDKTARHGTTRWLSLGMTAEEMGKEQGKGAGAACTEYGPAAVYACSKAGEYLGGKAGAYLDEKWEDWFGGTDCPVGAPDGEEQQWAAICQKINPPLYQDYFNKWRGQVDGKGLNNYEEACILRMYMADCLRQGPGAGYSNCGPGEIATPGGKCEKITGTAAGGSSTNPGQNADGSCKWGARASGPYAGTCWPCAPDQRKASSDGNADHATCPPPPPPPPMTLPTDIKFDANLLTPQEEEAPKKRTWPVVVVGAVAVAAAGWIGVRTYQRKPLNPWP